MPKLFLQCGLVLDLLKYSGSISLWSLYQRQVAPFHVTSTRTLDVNGFHCDGSAPWRELSLNAPSPRGIWGNYEISSVMNIGRDLRQRKIALMVVHWLVQINIITEIFGSPVCMDITSQVMHVTRQSHTMTNLLVQFSCTLRMYNDFCIYDIYDQSASLWYKIEQSWYFTLDATRSRKWHVCRLQLS